MNDKPENEVLFNLTYKELWDSLEDEVSSAGDKERKKEKLKVLTKIVKEELEDIQQKYNVSEPLLKKFIENKGDDIWGNRKEANLGYSESSVYRILTGEKVSAKTLKSIIRILRESKVTELTDHINGDLENLTVSFSFFEELVNASYATYHLAVKDHKMSNREELIEGKLIFGKKYKDKTLKKELIKATYFNKEENLKLNGVAEEKRGYIYIYLRGDYHNLTIVFEEPQGKPPSVIQCLCLGLNITINHHDNKPIAFQRILIRDNINGKNEDSGLGKETVANEQDKLVVYKGRKNKDMPMYKKDTQPEKNLDLIYDYLEKESKNIKVLAANSIEDMQMNPNEGILSDKRTCELTENIFFSYNMIRTETNEVNINVWEFEKRGSRVVSTRRGIRQNGQKSQREGYIDFQGDYMFIYMEDMEGISQGKKRLSIFEYPKEDSSRIIIEGLTLAVYSDTTELISAKEILEKTTKHINKPEPTIININNSKDRNKITKSVLSLLLCSSQTSLSYKHIKLNELYGDYVQYYVSLGDRKVRKNNLVIGTSEEGYDYIELEGSKKDGYYIPINLNYISNTRYSDTLFISFQDTDQKNYFCFHIYTGIYHFIPKNEVEVLLGTTSSRSGKKEAPVAQIILLVRGKYYTSDIDQLAEGFLLKVNKLNNNPLSINNFKNIHKISQLRMDTNYLDITKK